MRRVRGLACETCIHKKGRQIFRGRLVLGGSGNTKKAAVSTTTGTSLRTFSPLQALFVVHS